jgi:hypothetical protein
MPEAGQEETVRVVALDRSFHIACYKCEVCCVGEDCREERHEGLEIMYNIFFSLNAPIYGDMPAELKLRNI